MSQGFLVLILAAGKGTRFKSNKIKILHPILGKPMLHFVLDCVLNLKPENVYAVVGYQKEEVMKEFESSEIKFIHQEEQLGTAHAVMVARDLLKKKTGKDVLVINGDLPLLRPQTLKQMLAFHRKEGNTLTFLSAELENPTGFGRIIRSGNQIRIVEEKDAAPFERTIKEINAGVYIFKIKDLLDVLPKVSNQNKKGEYYITDIHGILTKEGKRIGAFKTKHSDEIIGVNSRYELAQATEVLRTRKIKNLTESGVTIYDPCTTWIDLEVKIRPDTIIYPSVIIEGNSVIGRECRIYPFVHIIESQLGNNVKVLSSTMIENSLIKDGAQVGPFVRLKPKTVIQRKAKTENFIKIKNNILRTESQAVHLSDLGNCAIKEKANVGAGTITCNNDNQRKNKTFSKERSFVGKRKK